MKAIPNSTDIYEIKDMQFNSRLWNKYLSYSPTERLRITAFLLNTFSRIKGEENTIKIIDNEVQSYNVPKTMAGK